MTMCCPRSRSPARHLIVLCLALVSSSESFHISSLSLGVRLVTNRIDNSCVRRAALGSSDEETPELSRRDALSSTGGALASLLIGSSLSFGEVLPALAGTPPDYGTEKRTVVLTGANSGIGYDAATRLASRGHRVVLACRTQAKAEDTASRIRSELGRDDADVIPLECDLSSIASIDSFVRALKLSIEGGIDSLCLNAGLARNTEAKDVLRTKEGFELTVGTNHLGHLPQPSAPFQGEEADRADCHHCQWRPRSGFPRRSAGNEGYPWKFGRIRSRAGLRDGRRRII